MAQVMRPAAIGLLALGAAHAAWAQMPPGPIAPPPPSAEARDPNSLPGDNLPPPLAAELAPPRPRDPHAVPPPEPPVPPAPPLTLAIRAAEAALAACHAQSFEVGTAVANSQGGIVMGMQADQAHPGRIYNAMRKNLGAIEFGVPTSVVRDRLRAQDYATLVRTRPNMTLFPGAVPLFSGGKLVGAIAVSGSPAGEIDESCAAAGAQAIKALLG
jgi:uncharacterized protein GlcG (DUF336 family)